MISLLLNRVRLRRGEALYLAAGNIHAYLSGLGIELMAASDNVLAAASRRSTSTSPSCSRCSTSRRSRRRGSSRAGLAGRRRVPAAVPDFVLYRVEAAGGCRARPARRTGHRARRGRPGLHFAGATGEATRRARRRRVRHARGGRPRLGRRDRLDRDDRGARGIRRLNDRGAYGPRRRWAGQPTARRPKTRRYCVGVVCSTFRKWWRITAAAPKPVSRAISSSVSEVSSSSCWARSRRWRLSQAFGVVPVSARNCRRTCAAT